MYKDILLPVDLDQASSWRKALPLCVEYCKAFGSNLHVMTVVPSFRSPLVGSFFPADFEERAREGARQHLHEFVTRHVPEGVHVQHIVGEGSVYEEIIRVSNEIDADLIVMSRGRTDLTDYILGPNAERVARHTTRSILIVQG